MVLHRKQVVIMIGVVLVALISFQSMANAQVSPAEILDAKLRGLEKAHLNQLLSMNQEISAMHFPFRLALVRYVGQDAKDVTSLDSRGIEFVKFRERTLLKFSANYSAAFSTELVTPNQRAIDVLQDIVVPILRITPKYFPAASEFDGYGFEIDYHVRAGQKNFGFEGKENLVVVIARGDVAAYLNARQDLQRQEILDRSQIFLNGKEVLLALGEQGPSSIAGLSKPEGNQPEKKENTSEVQTALAADPAPEPTSRVTDAPQNPTPQPVPAAAPSPTPVAQADTAPSAGAAGLDALQKQFQPQLDALAKEGLAHYHFVNYAPPSFISFHNQTYLQITLRNPKEFDQNGGSIYRRAAQSFDLFLGPMVKDILARISPELGVSGLDITVLHEFRGSPGSSEAVEFISPFPALQHFAEAEMTNQDLINQSAVLVNGVRVALNLAQVE